MTFLCLSLILPLFGIVIPFLGLPVAWTTVIIGMLTIGGPEVMIALAVIFLGKETLAYLKQKFFKLFKRTKPWKPVSKLRYYLGLVIFLGSIIPLYLNAYWTEVLPSDETTRHMVLMAGDLAFVCSFFILGGNFWDKFKSLFIWDKPKSESDASA